MSAYEDMTAHEEMLAALQRAGYSREGAYDLIVRVVMDQDREAQRIARLCGMASAHGTGSAS